MIAALAIGVGLLLLACVYCVGLGCRAIYQLCSDLERDRTVEYRHPVAGVPVRQEPPWLRRARA